MPGLEARKVQHSQGNRHESNEYAFYFNTAHIITQTTSFLLLCFCFWFFAILFLSFSRLHLHLLIFSKQFHGGSMTSHCVEYVWDWVFSAAIGGQGTGTGTEHWVEGLWQGSSPCTAGDGWGLILVFFHLA